MSIPWQRYADDHVRFVDTMILTDDGTCAVVPTAAPGHGFGLIGKHERAHSVGGALQVRHPLEEGFEVATRLLL
ncbi:MULTISPECIES: hypothetical protein [unclassified Streptomyces]|uniref:hypothetical protein n=1 Tax=unclassified Streptomyces TaxID=2593676 RepID=UPI002254A41C|nr:MULTISPECIES: hypothetical protein [unclassified Streptomyces]MCX5052347.1 hypothetical protein [Streptomyces sp. NBC_00474]